MRPLVAAHDGPAAPGGWRTTGPVVLRLGLAQTLAWASSFYLPAVLATPMAADLGVARPTVFALLSMALLVAALASPLAGRWIDRGHARAVLLLSSALFAGGLGLLAAATGLAGLVAAWLVLGLAMGCGLYDAAFAALVRLYGAQARNAITGITLMAGFASTVGWPLSTLMDAGLGWRGACVGWALLHLLLGLPLHAAHPRQAADAPTGGPQPEAAGAADAADAGAAHAPVVPESAAAAPQPRAAPGLAGGARRRMALRLALLFTLLGFVSTAVATHLPALLQAGGLGLAAAVGLAALAGPAQVAARLVELLLLRRRSVLVTARLAGLGHPLAAALLLVLGPLAALPFVVLHGLGNGLLTIVRGTLPLALFGAGGYGRRQGWIALPGRVLGALAPWLFGLALERWGLGALWWTAAAGAAAFVMLARLRVPGPP
jgi:hypothetical protein